MNTKVLVFGGQGLIGSRFLEIQSDFEVIAPTSDELNLLEKDKVEKFLISLRPEVIVNFAAYTNVDGVEKEKGDKEGIVYKLNSQVPKDLAEICQKLNKFLVHFSTSYVFDGTKNLPYKETDQPNPICWYAKTKHYADENITTSGCRYSIIRVEMPYRAHYPLKTDLARFFLEQLKSGKEILAVYDQKITPAFIDDIAQALKKIIESLDEGIFHIGPVDHTTPYDFAKIIAAEFNLKESLIKPISFKKYHKTRQAPRVQYSWLDVSKFIDTYGLGILHTNAENVKTFKKQVDTKL